MYRTLQSCLIFPLHFSLQIANLACWGCLIITLGLVKLLLPSSFLVARLNQLMNSFLQYFGVVSFALMKAFNKVELDFQIHGELSQSKWYLMLPNHLSYLDICLLIAFSYKKIPAPKFFLKKELIWMPFVGLGAWALDMPFMHRYSRAFLAKNPHLRGKDIETTRKSCEKFTTMPTTVINFVEGTRFTQEKQRLRQGDFKHLLPPKAGGIAFTLAAMGELFTDILDVTIQYPANQQWPMMDMLCGKLQKVVVHVNVEPISSQVVGDYFNDELFKADFQHWLNGLWQAKDQHINQLREGQ